MLQRPITFFKSSLVAGLLAMLPLALVVLVFGWVYGLVAGALAPITVPMQLPRALANLIVLTAILALGLLLGIMLKTRPGKAMFAGLERNLLHPIPGYLSAKETLALFTGSKKRATFLSVVLVDLTGHGVLVTGFVTEEHPDGSKTVFVPTSPNPTSGTVYHVPPHALTPTAVPAETALRCVISCGSGADALLNARQGRSYEPTA
jgi:uncharacterized membrane protein